MKTYRYITLIMIIFLGGLLISSCAPTTETAVVTATQEIKPTDTTEPTHTATAVASTTPTSIPTQQPTATATPQPTATATSTPDAETLFEEKFQQAKEYFEASEWKKAIGLFDDLVETDHNNKEIHRVYNGLGLANYYLGNIEEAVLNFDQAIVNKPAFADAYANRGDLWRDKGELEKAIADYDQAIELDPEIPRYYYNRAIVFKLLTEFENALADYDKAIELDPEFAYAFHNRANLYWNLGNYNQALADFDQALELEPTDKIGLRNRGMLHLQQSNKLAAHADFSQIIELCDAILISINGESSVSINNDEICIYAYLLRAETDYALENYAAAFTDLQQGTSQNASLVFNYFDYLFSNNPNSSFALFGRGLARVDLGESEEALADYNQAIQLGSYDPMRQNYYLARGMLYAFENDLERAISDWQQTIAIAPDNADAYINLGMAYYELGEYETAVNLLRTAITKDIPPDYQLELATNLIYNAEGLLFTSQNENQTRLAIASYDFVKNTIPDLEIPAGAWNNLCWGASVHGLAVDIMYACDLAVALEPTNGAVRDSRGLARALTDDFDGAIEDFQAFIDWGQGSQEDVKLRQEWITILGQGSNPIDDNALEILLESSQGY